MVGLKSKDPSAGKYDCVDTSSPRQANSLNKLNTKCRKFEKNKNYLRIDLTIDMVLESTFVSLALYWHVRGGRTLSITLKKVLLLKVFRSVFLVYYQLRHDQSEMRQDKKSK